MGVSGSGSKQTQKTLNKQTYRNEKKNSYKT